MLLQHLRTGGRLVHGCWALTIALVLLPFGSGPARAMDTDIFTAKSSAGAAPNVVVVLDNTSNWARQNQHWPGGVQQGQSEANALRTVIQNLPGSVNVGLFEFVTGGPATDNGGYVRFAVSPVGQDQGSAAAENVARFTGVLNTIYNNVTSPEEKQNSNTAYGNLFYDVYNYLAGTQPFASSADVVSSLADSKGYVSNYSQFKTPLSASTSCGSTYVIFIGNPNASGPAADSAANTKALSDLGGNTKQLDMPQYVSETKVIDSNLGYSAACYAAAPTGALDSADAAKCTSAYDSCSYSSTDFSPNLDTCPAGQQRYSVLATTSTSSGSTVTVLPPVITTGGTSSCYASSASVPSSDHGGLTCPAPTYVLNADGTETRTTYSCTYSVSSTVASSCPASGPTSSVGTPLVTTAATTACYSGISSGKTSDRWTQAKDVAGLTCPSSSTVVDGTKTTTTSYACTYSGAVGSSSGCSGSYNHINVTQTAASTVTVSEVAGAKYTVTQTATPTQTVSTVSGSSSVRLGNTMACYSSLPTGTPTDYACPLGATCSYSATGATSQGYCPTGNNRYQVLGTGSSIVTSPTGNTVSDTKGWNMDEWARFMHIKGIPVGGSTQPVSTYTIDVYNDQPNASQSGLLASAASAGGGKYFTAKNEAAIVKALQTIFSEIQAVNSTFASASLPISATNRAQNDNQVYIGMFRPDPASRPRWFGNLKRYQLGTFGNYTDLADLAGVQVVNPQTGFVTPCGISWWTSYSGEYWYDKTNDVSRVFITQATSPGAAWTNVGDDSNVAEWVKCAVTNFEAPTGTLVTGSPYSDLPDGPSVEKGGAAQSLRNLGPAARNMLTLVPKAGGGYELGNFDTSNVTSLSADTTVNSNIVKFIRGEDVTGEIFKTASSAARPSMHGDVVHSRPLPVTYSAEDVQIYYGAGDGAFRAVDSKTGSEVWSFVAPETFPSLQRLLDNSPLIQTPWPGGVTSGATAKEFFFDGSTGLYQNANNSSVWIYPSMRRGGRMIYAFDVTSRSNPVFKWRVGCTSTDDNSCSSGMKGIGQTWSTPQVAFLKGYSTTVPVVIVGGGYDTCEDDDSVTPSCGGAGVPKGSRVYVLDAFNGSILASFPTDRSVAADVSLIDINQDGTVDAAYVADTGGNLYRIDFSDPNNSFAPLSAGGWTIRKVAATTGSGRKFLFAPALLPYKNSVYVAIATGDREHPLAASYPYSSVLNRFYMYLDDPQRTGAAVSLDNTSIMYDRSSESTATCSSTPVLPATGTRQGWFMDLFAAGKPGEQAVTSALIIGGMVTFSSNRPVVNENSCTNSLGEARGYWVNLITGSGAVGVKDVCGGVRSSVFPGGGLPPSPVVGTVKVGQKTQTVVIGAIQRDAIASSSALGGQQILPPISSKRSRVYWRTNSDNR